MSCRLIDVLENWGLVSDEAIGRTVPGMPFSNLEKARDEIKESLAESSDPQDLQTRSLAPFNFVASSSLRGDTGCSTVACHVNKSKLLARYAALFCDRLVVPIELPLHTAHLSQSRQRFQFARSLTALVEMRPVIDAGIVIPVRAARYYCPKCFPNRVPQVERILEIQRELNEAIFDQFTMIYDPGFSMDRRKRIITVGPEAFLEHGQMNFRLDNSPEWLPIVRNGKMQRLNKEQKVKFGFVEDLLDAMAQDIAAHQVYGVQFDASYLTDRAGEAQFLATLNKEDALATRTASLCAQMTHSVPLFMNVPVATVMRIRKQEQAAFASHRLALSKILSEHVAAGEQLTEQQAKQLYMDVLEPEILNLQQQAENEQKFSVKKTAFKYGAAAAVVGIGAYTGLMPSHLTEICSALGGMKLVSDLAEALTSMGRNPTIVRNSNLYFLLRLKQEVE